MAPSKAKRIGLAEGLSEQPEAEADTAREGSSDGASRYSPSSTVFFSTFALYSAFRSYLALHLLFDSLVTLDAAVSSTLALSVIHSLKFIAYATIPF